MALKLQWKSCCVGWNYTKYGSIFITPSKDIEGHRF